MIRGAAGDAVAARACNATTDTSRRRWRNRVARVCALTEAMSATGRVRTLGSVVSAMSVVPLG